MKLGFGLAFINCTTHRSIRCVSLCSYLLILCFVPILQTPTHIETNIFVLKYLNRMPVKKKITCYAIKGCVDLPSFG